MWVIYNAETGNEIDRVESVGERDFIIYDLNANDTGERFAYRWED